MKLLAILTVTAIAVISCATVTTQKVYNPQQSVIVAQYPRTSLFINLDTITSKYTDNTVLLPEIEYSDSFYCSAVNNLLLYECSKLFTVKQVLTSSETENLPLFSVFSDYSSKPDMQKKIIEIAKKYDVGYVVIPYSCTLQHSAIRPQGWRGGKYEGSYEQPISYSANARLDVQIWNRDGFLAFEKIGTGLTGRPFLYDAVKKKRNDNIDIVKRSKKLFSPPLLRALSEAAHNVMILH
ncbi:MAG TPA: hypothetical protein VHO70_07330 [Chitinispirillaceae bacterium]|nr:hypothetical protein [Chitinispirillaceae bacterium]